MREKAISIVAEPFFTNGFAYLGLRKLEKSDFTVEEYENPKDRIMEYLSDGSKNFAFVRNEIKLRMSDALIKELEKIGYFKLMGDVVKFKELSQANKDSFTLLYRGCSIPLKTRLKTRNGGYIRNITKIEHIVDEAIVENRRKFKNLKEGYIDEMIGDFERMIGYTIVNNNGEYIRQISKPLNNRQSLLDLMELNSKDSEISDMKETLDVSAAKIEGEIAVYQKKINALEEKKQELFIETSKKLFEKQIKKLPEHIKSQLDGWHKDKKSYKARHMFDTDLFFKDLPK